MKTLDPETVYEKEWREMLEKHLSYQYPYEADILLHTKMSVSELKKQGQLQMNQKAFRQRHWKREKGR